MALKPTCIRIHSLWSGISHGTEMNFYRGTAPHITHDIDHGLFRPRPSNVSTYPIWHGYETVGEIVEVGAAVADFKLGDLVWAGCEHADDIVVDTDVAHRPFFLEKVPQYADPKVGIFLALAGVALDGHLTSGLRLSESVVISGLGAIGLFCVQLARLAGLSPIVAVDPISSRRQKAQQWGADLTIDPTQARIAEAVRERLGGRGRGVDAVIETSGNWVALHEAIRCCASGYGRVVALGFYQGPGQDLRLGEEFHHSSFYEMGASTILALNCRRQPAHGRAWDAPRVYHTVARMLADGQLQTEGLLTHTFPFDQAAQAFELIDKHPEKVIKVALTFPRSECHPARSQCEGPATK